MSIVEQEYDGPPSLSLDARETGESAKHVPVGRGDGVYGPQFRSHRETKMAARRTQRSTQKNRGL